MASINRAELSEITTYLRAQIDFPRPELLAKVELGVWVFPPFPLGAMNIFGPDDPFPYSRDVAPLFLAGQFGVDQSAYLLRMFRERHIPYLMVRTQSWEAQIICNGEVMSKHCDENLDAIREACEELRRQCKEKHPSVAARH